MMNKPNLFIIGAPKSGTTALANNLSQHQEIFLPRLKEPRFFDAHSYYDFKEDYPIETVDDYLSLYANLEAKIATYGIDASTFNMYSRQSIINILNLSPDAKFILILRDPVEASISMHIQRLKYADKKLREISDEFIECWNLLEERKNGKGYPDKCRNRLLFRYDLLYSYEKYVPFIKELVSPDNLHIGFYEDFKENPSQFYANIFHFLKLTPIEIINEKMNHSHPVRSSKLLQMIDGLSIYTHKFRERIGLTNMDIMKFIFNQYTNKNKSRKKQVEQRVYDEFIHTYDFMNELRTNAN